jgi:hypothetical protein
MIDFAAAFELSTNNWRGGDICLFIVIVITHRRFSMINNGGGLKLTPPRVSQGILFGGLSKQLGGSTPNPPGNSNTALLSQTFQVSHTYVSSIFDSSNCCSSMAWVKSLTQ